MLQDTVLMRLSIIFLLNLFKFLTRYHCLAPVLRYFFIFRVISKFFFPYLGVYRSVIYTKKISNYRVFPPWL